MSLARLIPSCLARRSARLSSVFSMVTEITWLRRHSFTPAATPSVQSAPAASLVAVEMSMVAPEQPRH